MKPIVFNKVNRPKPPPIEPEPFVFTCACGCEQVAPPRPTICDHDVCASMGGNCFTQVAGPDDEAEQFARLCGWRKNADGTYTCPPCAGGDHLAALKAILEGRGKERLS